MVPQTSSTSTTVLNDNRPYAQPTLLPHLGTRVMMLNARRIEPQPGRQLILLHIEDATGKKLN